MTMRRWMIASLLSSMGLLSVACAHGPTTPSLTSPAARSSALELIVKYKPTRGVLSLTRIPPSVEGTVQTDAVSFEDDEDLHLVRLPKGINLDAAIARYETNPRVEWVQPNYEVDARSTFSVQGTVDPMTAQQWYMDHVKAPEAWGHSTGSGVVVAVLDTGIDFAHPDLAGQVVNGPNYAGPGDPKDGYGHGTHVAGIIAAKADNGVGITGVAPGAKILNIAVLGADGAGSIFGIAKGIKYAADYGKKHNVRMVINLSLGGPARPDPINYLAAKYAKLKGALLIAASGNANGPVSTPARLADCLAVGASNQDDQRAAFSNFGPEVGISAPGVSILSTMPTYKVPLNDLKDTKGNLIAQHYASLQGTSMATPVVAGVAALVWGAHPDWSAVQVRERLQATARDLGPSGRDPEFGFGLVDAAAAVR